MAGSGPGPHRSEAKRPSLKLLLDTHFLIWVTLESPRLAEFPWLERYRPWGLSPVSLLEIQFLHEVGRAEVDPEAFAEALKLDDRFLLDDPSLSALTQAAIPLSWTRDPFDRLLCAHSLLRRLPMCSVDRGVREHHPLLPAELRARR